MAEALSMAHVVALFGWICEDSARALVAARVSLDDLVLSRNLDKELRAMGVKPWGDRRRVLSDVGFVRAEWEHGAY